MPYQVQLPIVITPADLPLHCSGPTHEAWDGQPRVFLPITFNGSIECSYCGSIYQLNGEVGRHH